MTTTTQVTPPLAPLLTWLHDNDVDYHVHPPTPTFTARATALAEGVDPHTFAKTVVVRADDGRRAMLVLDATDQLDLKAAARLLEAAHVQLLTEAELADLAPECDLGTVPPLPIWHLPIYADYGVNADSQISFHAGSHGYAVRVDRQAWERAADVLYGDLALHGNAPLWRPPTGP
ncbi:MAG TPA: YbaK/EbsC family protein [Candidatus Limnocylindrales bacterium]|nr:YbaK/EbsC family protein [Candidatus Limnocylindrales bacterium]